MLSGKKILLGVTGSIAAYKSALLVRELVKAGAEVKVLMTPDSKAFISPLTLSTLSKNPVLHSFQKNDSGEWNNHVDLGLWADLMVMAPCTANTLAKMANGTCDNLLMATYLSARCPVMIAPAMDLDMFNHPSTQTNLDTVKKHGVDIIDAEFGELASGLEGKGRMAEPIGIMEAIDSRLGKKKVLTGKRVLVTAGPTREAIDPVRYISNHSSGKMGYYIAAELEDHGAEVILVSGPTSISPPPVHKIINVVSAREMFEASQSCFSKVDIAVLSAAVSDYSPEKYSETKIKKEESSGGELHLKKTPDIASELGKTKTNGQFVVGFALETDNEEANALKKLKSKNFDMIVLNSLNEDGAGFGYETNKISIFDKDNNRKDFELKSKREVAKDIVSEIIQRI